MNKKIFGLSVSLFVFSLTLVADNAFADDRFDAMDKNSDTVLDLQEFMDANPNMAEQAFDIIDLDKNKSINHDEWHNFLNKHSTPDGLKMDATTTTMPAQSGANAPTMPPMGMPAMPMPPKTSTVNVPTPQIVKGVDSLPMLSAPSVSKTKETESGAKVKSPDAPTMPVMEVPKVNNPSVVTPSVEKSTNDNSLPLLSAPKNK